MGLILGCRRKKRQLLGNPEAPHLKGTSLPHPLPCPMFHAILSPLLSEEESPKTHALTPLFKANMGTPRCCDWHVLWGVFITVMSSPLKPLTLWLSPNGGRDLFNLDKSSFLFMITMSNKFYVNEWSLLNPFSSVQSLSHVWLFVTP